MDFVAYISMFALVCAAQCVAESLCTLYLFTVVLPQCVGEGGA